MIDTDVRFMQVAVEEARRAEAEGEVSVGAVVVHGAEIVGRGRNQNLSQNDPTAHAEMLALRQAARNMANHRLERSTLYVTMEPCAMCAGAAVLARLSRLVYGCDDPKSGAVRTLFRIADDSRLNHRLQVAEGILRQECAACIRAFFQRKRPRRGKDLGIKTYLS